MKTCIGLLIIAVVGLLVVRLREFSHDRVVAPARTDFHDLQDAADALAKTVAEMQNSERPVINAETSVREMRRAGLLIDVRLIDYSGSRWHQARVSGEWWALPEPTRRALANRVLEHENRYRWCQTISVESHVHDPFRDAPFPEIRREIYVYQSP